MHMTLPPKPNETGSTGPPDALETEGTTEG